VCSSNNLQNHAARYGRARYIKVHQDSDQLNEYFREIFSKNKTMQLAAFLPQNVKPEGRCSTTCPLILSDVANTLPLLADVQRCFSHVLLQLLSPVDDKQVEEIVAALPEVKELYLSDCSKISSSCLEKLHYPKQVTTLYLNNVTCTQEVPKQIAELCTKLEKLYISQAPSSDLTDDEFFQISYPESLQKLTLFKDVIDGKRRTLNHQVNFSMWFDLFWKGATDHKFVASSRAEWLLTHGVLAAPFFHIPSAAKCTQHVIPDLKIAIEKYPNDHLAPLCFAAYVALLDKREEFATAKKYIEDTLAREPDNDFAKLLLACLRDEKEKEVAKKEIEEVCSRWLGSLPSAFLNTWVARDDRRGALAETVIGQYFRDPAAMADIDQRMNANPKNFFLNLMGMACFSKMGMMLPQQMQERLGQQVQAMVNNFPQYKNFFGALTHYDAPATRLWERSIHPEKWAIVKHLYGYFPHTT
jgi:hypothetical protein